MTNIYYLKKYFNCNLLQIQNPDNMRFMHTEKGIFNFNVNKKRLKNFLKK